VSNRSNVILAGLALSPHAPSIALTACRFADCLNASVIFVHVGEDTTETKEKLQSLLASINITCTHEVLIRSGSPEDALLHAATEFRAKLLVTGALEQESVFQKLVGSVARKIVRRAMCSVLLVPVHVTSAPKFRNVVVSIRMDNETAMMLAFLKELFSEVDMTRFTLVEDSGFMSRFAARYVSHQERETLNFEHRQALIDYLSVFDFGDIEIRVEVLDEIGEGLALVDYARKTNADLVVFPAPARALTLWDRFLTHPTETVMGRIPCGILFFRPQSY